MKGNTVEKEVTLLRRTFSFHFKDISFFIYFSEKTLGKRLVEKKIHSLKLKQTNRKTSRDTTDIPLFPHSVFCFKPSYKRSTSQCSVFYPCIHQYNVGIMIDNFFRATFKLKFNLLYQILIFSSRFRFLWAFIFSS